MPEIPFDSDNVSLHSSSTTFSTAYQSINPRPRQLRRKSTVTQLRRWVSKRISRPSMTDNIRGNELSEQNLQELNKVIGAEAKGHGLEQTNTDASTASFIKERKGTFETISQIEDEPTSKPNLERERELHVRRSYAAFCEDFTQSGSPGPKRIFHMTMGMHDCTGEIEKVKSFNRESILEPRPSSGEALPLKHDQPHSRTSFQLSTNTPEHESLEPVAPGSEGRSKTIEPPETAVDDENDDLMSRIPPTHYPHPPSAIMTPAVYKEMQRATQERKHARKQKLLGPFRALFLKVQPLRTEV